ncbi:MAG: DsbA family protein [Acidimicrobiia bacterium]
MQFQITFDYLCPFARNAAEAVVRGLEAGRDWEVTHRAFSLAQVHLPDGEPDVWEAPDGRSGLLALQWGIAVRDHLPERFPAAHLALFAARHDHGRDLRDESVVREAVASAGVDSETVARIVAGGTPLEALATEHLEGLADHQVFGVPTVIAGDQAVFVRLMERGRPEDLDRVLDLIAWTGLNEFKRTTIPR